VNAVPYVPPVSLIGGQWPVASGQWQRYPLDVMGAQITVESPLVGRHQLRNLALAIAAAEELHNQGIVQITPETIAQGIRETHWPGRFQVVPAAGDNPEYVLDVAHNPAGAWALRSTLSDAYRDLRNGELGNGDPGNGREITMVFGVMRDKAVQEITEILFPIAGHVIVTHANNPRSASPDEIRQAAVRVAAGIAIEEAGDVASALDRARKVAGSKTAGPKIPRPGLVVVTGSIYIVGEAMRTLGVGI
jgi:dihydrofolate synthase/folylpolyglutamate synthase